MAVEVDKNISMRKLMGLLRAILSSSSRTTKKIKELENFLHYRDVLFYTWKILLKDLNATQESGDVFMLNALELLEKIAVKNNAREKEGNAVECGISGPKKFVFCPVTLQKYVRKVWHSLINRDMSRLVLKKLLFVLLEHYLPKLEKPMFLTDLLMSCLNLDGVVRILALQGMATLMQKHNIEYPNIYGKLYSLFERKIFHTKYKSRLFYLANLFLSSLYLPETMVASFAKRVARFSLTCATPDLLIILRFVGNLLIRHSGLVKMIQSPNAVEVKEDPFLEDERDPMKTKAIESSLWELSLLSNHCQPSISSAANFINFKLPSMEYDLDAILENSYEKMFESECRKTKKVKPSLTFERPHETVARLKDDRVFKLWALTN